MINQNTCADELSQLVYQVLHYYEFYLACHQPEYKVHIQIMKFPFILGDGQCVHIIRIEPLLPR
jgi:hypothetical protein